MSEVSREALVSRAALEAVIDSIDDLKQFEKFMKGRWVGMVLWWNTRSEEAKHKYFLLRGIIVTGGVLIPVLTTLSMQPGWREYATVATSIVGATVAGCAAWEGFANYGEIWREKRRAAELLKVEGWQFLQRCGKYQSDENYQDAFPRFAAEVENMIAREVGEYLAVFDASLAQARKQGEKMAEEIVEQARKRISSLQS